ncbi:MAG TPA: D-glycero-beta-D-manno-heptose 1-phosphate adenylyltransferase [Bacteroidales bacterium]|nr:D-glycero-beta-D-manno-heptose 1-phosphate adenylyltransferase [Bacteroidales bacterium]HPS49316.1 D-glycero-beta-D-manno-heptose 1-phosphate adenylyltransferase [Bacteroidales bacterium]
MENLKFVKDKIFTWDRLQKRIALWRFKGKKIVFTNGCFDILHLGHIEYLSKSRDLGDVLVVGLNSDESVRRIKGTHRPVNNQDARSITLAALSFVDAVILFGEDTPLNLIRQIQPDILVKGKDYEGKEIVGTEVVKARGGIVATIELTKGFSTTGIIDKSNL